MHIKGNKIRLSDKGETLQNLKMCGFNLNTPKKEHELNIILDEYGILKDKDILYVDATAFNFAKKQDSFIQALLSINTLAVLAQAFKKN